MNRLLIALLLLPFMATAQLPGRMFTGIGAPSGTYNNFGLKRDYYRDSTNGYVYHSNVAGVWYRSQNWGGGTGLNSFTIGTVTTLSAGSSATVTNSGTAQDPVLNFGLPRGSNGATGPAGGGSGSWAEDLYTSPDKYGALHANTTCAAAGYSQAYVDSAFAGTNATTAWTVDRAAWQMAINEATDNKKALIAYGDYYVNGTTGGTALTTDKYYSSFTIEGNGAYVHATGSNAYTVFGVTAPSDNGDANVMTNNRYIIKNLQVGGNTAASAFELGPSYCSRFDDVSVYGMAMAITLRFALATYVSNLHVNDCANGMYIGIGNWSGAGTANSQSNSTIVESSRFYSTSSTGIPIHVYACSGVWIKNVIVEGSDVLYGIKFDGASSTVVKDFHVLGLHYECNPGTSSQAAIYVRMAGGIFNLDGAFGQYACKLVDAGATVGYLNVKVSNVPYWVPRSGYYYNNAGNTSWYLDWDEYQYGAVSEIPSRFSGTAVTNATAGTMGNGNNKVIQISIPR